MRVTVIVAVLNEEGTIKKLLNSLLNQTRLPDEILVIDGRSKDKTVEIVKDYHRKYPRIKLIESKTTRASARNLGAKNAKNYIIASIDAGCVAEKHWLERLTDPFKNETVGMVAGFYEMVGDTPFRKALSVYLGIPPHKFDDNFLASARSLAFTKDLWKKVGGFPEDIKDTAEDTIFNYRICRSGAKIIRVKDAIVYWELPYNLLDGLFRIYRYARGDAQSNIWWHPVKKLNTHNIKISLIYLRYFFGLSLLLLSAKVPDFSYIFLLCFVFYLFWAFKKVYLASHDWKAGVYGIVLQTSSDVAVMLGFFRGITGI